jgi:ATP-binding cassette subfamily B protein
MELPVPARRRRLPPQDIRRAVAGAPAAAWSAPRVRALRLMWQAAPGLSLLAVAFVLAEGALPVLVLIAMGRVTGAIPGAVIFGLGSPAGHALIGDLAEAGGIYALSLLRAPFEDGLSAAVDARMEALMQTMLAVAACAPVGIEPLEDQDVLERLSSAQGQLLNARPAEAPMQVVSLAGDRLTGILACAVLASWRWWVGLGLLALWLLVRRPLAQLIRARTTRARSAGPQLRRSWYMLGLAWRPPAAKEMRVFGLSEWAAERHREEWLSAMEPSWRQWRALDLRVWASGAVVLLAYGGIAAKLGIAAEHRVIGLRELATLLPMLPASLAAGSISYADIQLELSLSGLPDLHELVARLRSVPSLGDGGGRSDREPVMGRPRECVRLERVSFAYPGGEPVLDGLELELQAGRSLGLVGANGAGKSTLIALLARMREPTSGVVTVDGTPLQALEPRAWQRAVAVVYQDFARLPLSVSENVGMFGEGRPDMALVARALERAGAAKLVASLPRGADTVLSPHFSGGVDLSGGQWQRIALARALYAVQAGARLLVLDEPTSQLDIRGEAAFYERFLELTRGVSSIVISHRFASVRRAERIAVLHGGRIAELGSHDELLAAGGRYAEMFRLQAERFATEAAPS